MDETSQKPQVPGKRLKLITNLLMTMQKSLAGQDVAGEVLRRIQARMDPVPGEILQDFEAVATDFEISTRDAEEIMRLYQNCFDRRGNFLRAAFEKNVPKFAHHEKKVFEILWEFLKETPRRSNRLPFLNSLQLLVAEIKKPIQAIKALLTNFTHSIFAGAGKGGAYLFSTGGRQDRFGGNAQCLKCLRQPGLANLSSARKPRPDANPSIASGCRNPRLWSIGTSIRYICTG